MGSLRLTLCTGMLAACAVTPVAHAADGRGVLVTPASPAPGGEVALRVTGCPGGSGTATSTAFAGDAELTPHRGALAGGTRVDTATAPGSYDVSIRCADVEIRGAITVVARGSASAAPASPVAPVPAGGGGTAHLADDAEQEGPGIGHAVTGLALAGVAAAAVALRGARRRRGAD
ncbi:hypothetical protein [Streptomyces sp. MAA16]|uniref:hypothetical protein n=1 Tax=Streptomyces sp. MAA16 TaxID=3035116 RepID=UPI002474EFB5|nr:hypothetical protein [Streptomyces sp. MAA16]MDH6702245.1 hypothetical protein [Streptomyces sp. MAA16]